MGVPTVRVLSSCVVSGESVVGNLYAGTVDSLVQDSVPEVFGSISHLRLVSEGTPVLPPVSPVGEGKGSVDSRDDRTGGLWEWVPVRVRIER